MAAFVAVNTHSQSLPTTNFTFTVRLCIMMMAEIFWVVVTMMAEIFLGEELDLAI